MARPDDRSGVLREQTVTTAAEKHESMIESIEAVPCITKTLAAPARPAPTDRRDTPWKLKTGHNLLNF
eukprot:1325410-Prymnesium_polylepis.1